MIRFAERPPERDPFLKSLEMSINIISKPDADPVASANLSAGLISTQCGYKAPSLVGVGGMFVMIREGVLFQG